MQVRVALAERGVEHLMLRHLASAELGCIARIPAHAVADAPQPAVPGGNQCFQYRLRALAEREIGVPDDAGAKAGLAVASARAHFSDTVDQLDFAGPLHV